MFDITKKDYVDNELNKKVDKFAKFIENLPTEKNESYLFFALKDLTDSYGVTIPAYSRGIFINHDSTDGVLIAVDQLVNLIIGFRNNGIWHLRKI